MVVVVVVVGAAVVVVAVVVVVGVCNHRINLHDMILFDLKGSWQILNPASCDGQNLMVASCDGKVFRVSYQSASGSPRKIKKTQFQKVSIVFQPSIFIGDVPLVFGFGALDSPYRIPIV